MSDAGADFDTRAKSPGLEAFGLYHKALALASAGDFEGADNILSGREAGQIALMRRGAIAHGPLLYLRGGLESDVELELIGDAPVSLVHAVATIAGDRHRVRLTARKSAAKFPALPILAGFGMPTHAEMSSAIAPAPAKNIDLASEIGFAPVFSSDLVVDCKIITTGRNFPDADFRKDPGPWDLPPNGIANGPPLRKR